MNEPRGLYSSTEEVDPLGHHVDVDTSKKLEEKMDKDFLFFLSYIPVTYRNIKEDNEKLLCREWLKRLTNRKPMTAGGKRNRNIYIVNLILQMGDGKLSPPFTSHPPLKLKPARNFFGGIPTGQPCSENLNFDVEDVSEYSRDGRTFFATKSLQDGKGAFAYIGVSSGGGDTIWVNAAGEPICLDKVYKRQITDEEKEASKHMGEILSERTPCPDRNELVDFYEGLLCQVSGIIKNYGTDNEPSDPVVEKMLEDLQMEKLAYGTFDAGTLGCYTRLNWLQELKKKLQQQQRTASERQNQLKNIEAEVNQKDNISFVDFTNVLKSSKVDTMFDEAARDRPSQYNVEILKRYYPECIVQKLLMLLGKEKYHVISQQRSVYQDFILQLKEEVMNVVRRGLEKYAIARKEWHRVATVMRHVDEEKNRIIQEAERYGADLKGPDFIDKDNLLNEELDKAKKKLEDAKHRNDQIETRITSLHELVHSMSLEYEKMEEEVRGRNGEFEAEINYLEREIKHQEQKIENLSIKFNERFNKNCPENK